MASTPDDSPQYNAFLEEKIIALWEYIKPDDPKAAQELLDKLFSYWHIKEIPYG